MNCWNQKLRLLAVLSTTRTMSSRSTEDGWGFESPQEATDQLDQIIDAVFYEDPKGLPKYWQLLYAPTGPLQEIAMANGWSDEYLKLAEEFDSLQSQIKEYETQAAG